MNSLIKASLRAAVASVPERRLACPFCDFRAVSSEHRVGRLIRCPDCRSLYSAEPINSETAASRQPRKTAFWNSRVAWIRNALGYAPRRILDLGGSIEFLEAWPWTVRRDVACLYDDGSKVVSESAIRFLSLQALQEDTADYDVVTWYAEGIDGRTFRKRLELAGTRLAPGGILALGLPTLDCRKHRFGRRPCSNGWFADGAEPSPSRDWVHSETARIGLKLEDEFWSSGGREAGSAPIVEVAQTWLCDREPLRRRPILDYYEALLVKGP